MVQKISVSLIIVNYNSKDYLNKCLSSILEGGKFQGEIIVVDNNSSDGSTVLVREKFPQIKLIENKENLGFAKANNIGIKNSTSEYILLLNPDTELSNNCINTLINIGSEYNNLGVLGCKILNPDGSLQFSCGKFPTLLNVLVDRIPIIRDIFQTELIRQSRFYEREQKPDWVSGVCMFIPRTAFETVGGFDESYFMYVEEVDLCYRLKRAGHTVAYTPHATVAHHYQGGVGPRKRKKSEYMREGLLKFFKKHKSNWEYRLLRLLVQYF